MLAAISTEGKLSFFKVEDLRKFELEIGTVKPFKTVKSKQRLLCLAINHVEKETSKKKKKQVLGKREKKGKKVSKDEKMLLKRQKHN